jgi:hypothetical protein
MGGAERAVQARAYRLGREGELGEERKHVGHHQQLAARPGCRHHRVGVAGRQRDRLLDQHVLARLERPNGEPGVLVVRHAEVDQFDAGVGEQLTDVLKPGVLREVHL